VSTPSMTLADAVEGIRRQHVAALNAGDADAAAALFAADGISLPPGQPPLEGVAAIYAWFTGLFATIDVKGFEIQPAGVQIFGDALIEHGTWKGSFKPKGAPAPLDGGGAYVTVYARLADGSVRIIRDIFHGLPGQ